MHMFFVCIYDWEMRKSGLKVVWLIGRLWNLIIFRLFIFGCLQPVAALITALFICPFLSLLVILCKRENK